MKELVVLSGKGGTGKTSLTACLARLSGHVVVGGRRRRRLEPAILLNPEPNTGKSSSRARRRSSDPERNA
jgi:predicted ATPase